MSCRRVLSVLAVGVVAWIGFFTGAPAQQGKKATAKPVNEIIQVFPSNEVMRTAWKVHWATRTGNGLYIQDAWFKRGPKDPWMQVLGDARIAEIFVPYHTGSPRFWDIDQGFDMRTLTREDAGPHGKLLGNPPLVCAELRDRGIIWVETTKGSRRGQTLVLWGAIHASNYYYITEFGFQDDGTITFRLGSTGRNYPSREWEGHMHNGMWRVDVNLDGPSNNSVYLVEHLEPDGEHPGKARTRRTPFNQGSEGGANWDALRFTSLQIVNDKKKNKRGQIASYELMSLRMGNARHYNDEKEECSHHDFWVTRNKPGELFYPNVPKYVRDQEPIMNTDVVIWHSAAGHHEPRSEDGEMLKNELVGATPVMWSGFDLRPRNIFDRSPLYP
jgi:primary-amine oxidase